MYGVSAYQAVALQPIVMTPGFSSGVMVGTALGFVCAIVVIFNALSFRAGHEKVGQPLVPLLATLGDPVPRIL
jgi:hypothetical protein